MAAFYGGIQRPDLQVDNCWGNGGLREVSRYTGGHVLWGGGKRFAIISVQLLGVACKPVLVACQGEAGLNVYGGVIQKSLPPRELSPPYATAQGLAVTQTTTFRD